MVFPGKCYVFSEPEGRDEGESCFFRRKFYFRKGQGRQIPFEDIQFRVKPQSKGII